MKSDRQRTAALVSINAQVAEDEASAAYLKQAQGYALHAGDVAEEMGWLKAGATILGGIGSAFSMPGGSRTDVTNDPTRLGSLY